jgi:hypothetical protein
MKMAYLIAVLALLGTANAQLFGGFCSSLYSGAGLSTSLSSASTYSGLVGISLLLVLLVLTALGVVYAFGYGFGIESLKRFARTEFIESAFNLVVIGVIASGLAFAGGAISFISALGSLGASSLAAVTGSGAYNSSISSASSLYLALCNNYIHSGLESLLPDTIALATTQGILSALQQFNFELMPNYFGFSFSPYAGIQPVVNLIGMQLGFFMLMIGISIAIPIFLYIVYFLFPVFLYVGVLLRSFPWTRAAGGSMLALFISFYIVFPSLLYPFSTYAVTQFQSLPVSSLSGSGFSLQALLTLIPISTLFGSPVLDEISGFSAQVSQFAVQLLGIVISLIIALDLTEALGDLLGSPSLQGKKLLSKVI